MLYNQKYIKSAEKILSILIGTTIISSVLIFYQTSNAQTQTSPPTAHSDTDSTPITGNYNN